MNRDKIITPDISLLEALKMMDKMEGKLLIICDIETFVGVISIGDIQRAIINKTDLNDPVCKHIRADITYANVNDNKKEIRALMRKDRIECMPVVDDDNKLVDIIEWSDVFFEEKAPLLSVDCPVVIMAGGKGERLKPLTNIIPKPLIPVSGKTIIEEIIDRFLAVSCKRFYLSVNYKADTIKDYFDKIPDKRYSLEFVKEDEPLGTAGSLFLLKSMISSTFIVSNCDAIIDVNLYDLMHYHKTNGNVATLVSVVKEFSIPYGVVETTQSGELVELKEKPDMVYQVNCGLYVLEPKAFEYIVDNTFLNITDLLTKIKIDGGKVGVFPVSSNSWKDMGNWDEYLKMIHALR